MGGWWLSVDGAKGLSGVAQWHGSTLVKTCAIKGLKWEDWSRMLFEHDGIVLEDGYVGKSRKTGLVLAFARGTIAGYSQACGGEVLGLYQATSWRRKVGIATNAVRKVQKQSAQAMCRWLAAPPDDKPPAKAGSIWAGMYVPILANATTADECEAALMGYAHLVKQGEFP